MSFYLRGKTLPVDYASPLAQVVTDLINWQSEPQVFGIHLAAAGEEGNGWYRDENPEQVIYLPRRTRIVIRVHQSDKKNVLNLVNAELDIEGHSIKLEQGREQFLSPITTQYARHIASDEETEQAFLEHILDTLNTLNIRCKKMLCGKSRTIKTSHGIVRTRSLLLSDLSKEDALLLQKAGIGPHREIGCGFFLPHKSIQSL